MNTAASKFMQSLHSLQKEEVSSYFICVIEISLLSEPLKLDSQ